MRGAAHYRHQRMAGRDGRRVGLRSHLTVGSMTSSGTTPRPADDRSDRLRLLFSIWSALVNTAWLVWTIIQDH